ncbi:protein kinase [Streptomyces sp. T-3]|nr:protein kinase [Streptomyces sp. T-3]
MTFTPLTHDDPEQLGGHRLIARLGSGGMGTVYLARSATGRTAALKTMHARIAADQTFRTRFRLEVDAARVIGDHHGARVFDADAMAQTPWLATEYVIGPPLDDAVGLAGPLPEPAVRSLGALLCAALAQLHASDVVHRDLKPSNIMLTADGPKVIDFGIARAIGDERLTSVGAAAGTPAFMSPEQATGQEHTPAGDVFALAGVLLYAATGHGPFGGGAPADLLYRVRYAEPDLTGTPEGLTPILTRCLSKDPAGRPSTSELAAQLAPGHAGFSAHLPEALLADIGRRATEVWRVRPHRLPPPPGSADEQTATSTSTGVTRRTLLTVGGTSALGVAAVGGGAWAWFGRQNNTSPKAKPTKAPKSKPSAVPNPDRLWQVPIAEPKNALVPSLPFTAGTFIGIADSKGVLLYDADRGGVEMEGLGKPPAHQCAAEVIGESLKADALLHLNESPAGEDGPLRIKTLDPISGEEPPAAAEFRDFNGGLLGTQLLCAMDDVLYLAAGRGKQSGEGIGFAPDQSWWLLAVHAKKRKILWRQPLPERPAASRRLHFLDAQIVPKHLVLLQEGADGKVKISVRDNRSGKLRWELPLEVSEPEELRGLLAISIHDVFPPTGPLRAVGLENGEESWNAGKGRARTGPPTSDTEHVYAVEEGVGIVAVDAYDGKEVWREKDDEAAADADLTTPPIAVYGHVYTHNRKQERIRILKADTGRAIRPYQSVGSRLFKHDGIPERILAVGDGFLDAFEMKAFDMESL